MNEYTKALDKARAEVRTQLVELEAALERHATKVAESGTNWGFVGDLNRVAQVLSEVNETFAR